MLLLLTTPLQAIPPPPPPPHSPASLSIANLPPFLQRNLDPSPSMIFQKSQSSL